jgi:hypothetical protein
MALCETDKEQPDAFPNNVKVMVNGALVTLPVSEFECNSNVFALFSLF